MEGKLQTEPVAFCPADHIVLRARSMDASVVHYSALLPLVGFARTAHNRWRNRDGLLVEVQQAEAGSHDYSRCAPGLNHLGFRASDPSVLEEVRRRLQAAGRPAPEIQHFPGALALFVPDPDGIRFEIGWEEAQ
jgi:catechol 2,3-dioxygenase-like lactoylglutathione lyase family enzyme